MCKTIGELESVVAEYRSMKAMKEELDENLKSLEREIIGYLDLNEKVSETGSNFTVKISNCERKTLDAGLLEARFGNLSDFQKISQYRRLYVR